MVVPFLQTSTFSGLVSTKDYGTSQDWSAASTFVRDNSAMLLATSGTDIPTILDYLSTNNISIQTANIITDLFIQGNTYGLGSLASFNNATAEGSNSFAVNSGYAKEESSFAGNEAEAYGASSAAFNNSVAVGQYSFAVGDASLAHSENAFSGGVNTAVSGYAAFGFGSNVQANSDHSFATGNNTIADGIASHVEGETTYAQGYAGHAEGSSTQALGDFSHAEGLNTVAYGNNSHAEGQNTVAYGNNSHAAGTDATAAQDYTYAWSDGNLGTLTENISTTRTGQYMVSASGGVFIPGSVGIGTDSIANALTVTGVVSASNVIYALDGDSTVWNSASSTAFNASVNYTNNYVNANFVPTSGGSIAGNLLVNNNVTIFGNLTALGTTTIANTVNSSTSSLSVVNIGPGPALYVYQGPGNYDVASFVDGDGIEVLHVGNANPGGLGFVGINESFPIKELCVKGSISATEIIYDNTGNSNQWNSTYTYVTSNSANFILDGGNTKNSNLLIGTNNTFDLNLETNNTTRVTITSTGNVGIGTTFPNEILTVAGNISSTNVVYAQDGNSNIWNSTNTLVQNNSGNWNEAYQVSTNLQSNSAAIFNTGDFTFNTNASPQTLLFTHTTNLLKKVPVRNVTYIDLTGGLVTVNNVSGNAFEGDLSMSNNFNSVGNAGNASSAILLISGVDPSQYHVNYNNLNYHYSSIAFNNMIYSLTAIRFPELKICNNLYIGGCSHLLDLNLNNLEYAFGILGIGSGIGGYAGGGNLVSDYLTNVNLEKLKFVGNTLSIGGYGFTREPVLSSVNLNNLEYVLGNLNIGNLNSAFTYNNYHELTQIQLPNLLVTSGQHNFSGLTNLKTLEFPKLKKTFGGSTSTFVNNCSSLQNISFPELEYCIGGYLFNQMFQTPTNTISLTSISIPKIKIATTITGINLASTASLRNVEFGTNTLQRVDGTFQCQQTLNQQSVDNILKAFSRLDGTNNTVRHGASLLLAGSNSAPSYTGGVTTTSPGTNFVRTGFVVNANVTNHGHTTDDIITFTGNGQAALNGTYTVRVSSANQFEYTTPTSGSLTGSGTVTMRRTVFATDGFRYFQNVALRGATVTINFP